MFLHSRLRPTIYLLFFISGFCALLYQVVWMRLSFAHFGITTSVLSLVISIFMLGLALGSWLGGKYVVSVSKRFSVSAIYIYAVIELCIGSGAFIVPLLFKISEKHLLSLGTSESALYLVWSSIFICASILPWTFLMGLTYPVITAFLKERFSHSDSVFSFLYTANTIGALLGTIVTALVLIELLGFKGTLTVAFSANILIAIIAAGIGRTFKRNQSKEEKNFLSTDTTTYNTETVSGTKFIFLTLLFINGFASMAFEVIWTRMFTVIISTEVYSFAFLLFIYLLATWVGVVVYRRHLLSGKLYSVQKVLGFLIGSIIFMVIVNDVRIGFNLETLIIGIFPFCAILGYLTPMIIDTLAKGTPHKIGSYYALNTIGCILGPLAASYILLPFLSVQQAILITTIPFIIIGFVLIHKNHRRSSPAYVVMTGAAVCLVITFFFSYGYENVLAKKYNATIYRDNTATVVAFNDEHSSQMLVNGIGITSATPLTKIMAHLPLAFHQGPVKNVLNICFGMGTTFRSLSTWNVDVTAIDLVPSVPRAFPFYFSDTEKLLSNPKNHIIIDDGRRYMARTNKQFDIITLDPPPPVPAAGSSLLYSEEFYVLAKSRLAPAGVIQQWLPQSDEETLAAVTHSLTNNFKYVKVYASYEYYGHHFIASDTEIPDLTAKELVERMPQAAQQDLVEWNTGANKDPATFLSLTIDHEIQSTDLIKIKPDAVITDNQPYNEYYLLRKYLNL